MARPGKWDHIKPEVFRLIKEGFKWAEIMEQFPNLPKGTLSGWFRQVENISSESSEPSSEPQRVRLPIDPESPLEKIKNALWDIVYQPEGKGTAVQALNCLIRVHQMEWEMSAAKFEPGEMSEAELKKIASGRD